MSPQFILVYESLANEAFSGSTVKKREVFGHFQSDTKRNYDLHSVESW